MSDSDIAVRGNASPEEVAAVVALLARTAPARPDGYAHWRSLRLAAIRRPRS